MCQSVVMRLLLSISKFNGASYFFFFLLFNLKKNILCAIRTQPLLRFRQTSVSLTHSLLYMLELTDAPIVTSNMFIRTGIGNVKDGNFST